MEAEPRARKSPSAGEAGLADIPYHKATAWPLELQPHRGLGGPPHSSLEPGPPFLVTYPFLPQTAALQRQALAGYRKPL